MTHSDLPGARLRPRTGFENLRPALPGREGSTSPLLRSARASAGLHAALLAAAAAAADAGLIIAARGALKPADLASSLGAAVAVVAYATLGSLIVRGRAT